MREVRVTVIDQEARAERLRRARREAGAQFLAAVAIVIGLIVLIHLISTDGSYPAFLRPSIHRQSASLLAGQTLVIHNSRPIRIRVQSDYPVSVSGLNCRAFREVDVSLYCGPSDLSITDFRPSLLITGHANRITYAFTLE